MDQSADLFELASGIDEVCARLEDTCNALRILDQLLSPESLPPAPAANAEQALWFTGRLPALLSLLQVIRRDHRSAIEALSVCGKTAYGLSRQTAPGNLPG